MKILLWYLLIVNAVSLLLMLVDKRKAKKNKWRIRESTLLFWACIGGSIGALAGMYLFRHKTRHPKFTIGIPLMLALQVIGATVIVICLR